MTGLPGPSTLHSQVFRTSQCFLPPVAFPALFHAGRALGILPFRAFPSLKSGAPFGVRSPPAVTSHVFELAVVARSSLYLVTGPSSGALTSSESVRVDSGVSPNATADALVGFLPSKGLPWYRMTSISQGLLSRSGREVSARLTIRLDLFPEPQSVVPVPCGWSPRGDCRPSWGSFPFHSS